MRRFLARCPKCRTSFRIRPEQLDVAGGMVRCGGCLSVFAAAEHRVFLRDDHSLGEAGEFSPEHPTFPPRPALDSAGADADPPLVAEEQSVALLDETEAETSPNTLTVDDAGRPASEPRDFVNTLADEDGLGCLRPDELAALDDAPIEMEAARPARRGGAALWLSANLALALLLAGQVAWARFDDLLADPRFRPALELLCRHAGCALATFRDVAAIHSEALSVRSHPGRADALQVDFVFRNNAELPQDFPLVELNFHDMGGRLLANRLFTPAEYLADDLRELRQMPAKVPVQVSLELLDPGPLAVNYSLAFRLP